MRHSIATLTVAALACASARALAQDMTFTPAASGAVRIQTPGGTSALAVQPTGAVQLPLLPGAAAASGTPVCHDASGTLQSCDTAAMAGLKGDKGDRGDKGDAGTPGPAGAKGDAGPQGLKGDKGDAGIPGLKGDQGPKGAQGPKGEQGGPGVDLRHGCFLGNGAISSGTGYTVTPGAGYSIQFTPSLGTGSYTLLLDARTSTGRALAITYAASGTGLTLTPGWLDAGGETIHHICFMLVQ